LHANEHVERLIKNSGILQFVYLAHASTVLGTREDQKLMCGHTSLSSVFKTGNVALLTVILCLGAASPSIAHHSIAAEFDSKQRTTLSGTVTKVEWGNPHTFFYLDVKDQRTGNIINWTCELGSPNTLVGLGWDRATLKVGMTVSLNGILARDGSHKVIARNLLVDGKRLAAWPSEHPF
jgi:hypothetical protein